jgi:hypothetical protein
MPALLPRDTRIAKLLFHDVPRVKENGLVLAHIRSRLAVHGDWRTRETCQRAERPLAALCRALKNQGRCVTSRVAPKRSC